MPVAGGDDRLVVKQQLELVDGVAQFADQRQAPVVVTALLVGRVDTEAAARTLGGVHRDIRPAHQGIGVIGVLGEDRDADAAVDVDRLGGGGEGGGHRLEGL